MSIQAGERMPAGSFTRMTGDGPKKLTTDELFKGKTVVLFSVPGAFTPTCDARHLPGYVDLAWGKHGKVGDSILMLADGNGDYVKALGLELNATGFGMGTRGQRFALVVKDGVAAQVFVEAPGEFKVSAADYVLKQL
jgi:peroxiredoxin